MVLVELSDGVANALGLPGGGLYDWDQSTGGYTAVQQSTGDTYTITETPPNQNDGTVTINTQGQQVSVSPAVAEKLAGTGVSSGTTLNLDIDKTGRAVVKHQGETIRTIEEPSVRDEIIREREATEDQEEMRRGEQILRERTGVTPEESVEYTFGWDEFKENINRAREKGFFKTTAEQFGLASGAFLETKAGKAYEKILPDPYEQDPFLQKIRAEKGEDSPLLFLTNIEKGFRRGYREYPAEQLALGVATIGAGAAFEGVAPALSGLKSVTKLTKVPGIKLATKVASSKTGQVALTGGIPTVSATKTYIETGSVGRAFQSFGEVSSFETTALAGFSAGAYSVRRPRELRSSKELLENFKKGGIKFGTESEIIQAGTTKTKLRPRRTRKVTISKSEAEAVIAKEGFDFQLTRPTPVNIKSQGLTKSLSKDLKFSTQSSTGELALYGQTYKGEQVFLRYKASPKTVIKKSTGITTTGKSQVEFYIKPKGQEKTLFYANAPDTKSIFKASQIGKDEFKVTTLTYEDVLEDLGLNLKSLTNNEKIQIEFLNRLKADASPLQTGRVKITQTKLKKVGTKQEARELGDIIVDRKILTRYTKQGSEVVSVPEVRPQLEDVTTFTEKSFTTNLRKTLPQTKPYSDVTPEDVFRQYYRNLGKDTGGRSLKAVQIDKLDTLKQKQIIDTVSTKPLQNIDINLPKNTGVATTTINPSGTSAIRSLYLETRYPGDVGVEVTRISSQIAPPKLSVSGTTTTLVAPPLTIYKYGTRTKLDTAYKSKLDTKTKQKTKVDYALKLRTDIATDVDTKLKIDQAQKQRTATRTKTALRPATIVPSFPITPYSPNVPNITNFTNVPIIPIVPLVPFKIGLPTQQIPKKKKRKPTRPVYKPSLIGVELDIRAARKPAKITGVEIRPIVPKL